MSESIMNNSNKQADGMGIGNALCSSLFIGMFWIAVFMIIKMIWFGTPKAPETDPNAWHARRNQRELLSITNEFGWAFGRIWSLPKGGVLSSSPKVLVLDYSSISDGFVKIPVEISVLDHFVATDSAQVNTLFVTYRETEQVGHYSGGGGAFRYCWHAVLINRASKTIITNRIFVGEDPPRSIGGMMGGSNFGDPPTSRVRAWLKQHLTNAP